MQMFTISVVFFIFCCKFYTFFYVCMLVHCCAECRMMQRVLQRFGRPSAMFGNPFATYSQSVRNPFRGCTWVYCGVFATHFGVFATHSQSVQNTFTECSQRVRFLYVTYSHYKSMVFAVQKYGFCRAKRGFLSYKSMVFVFECCIVVIRLPRIRRMFATLLQFVRHAFAICSPRCCNPFATFSHLISSVVAICLQAKSLNLLCV